MDPITALLISTMLAGLFVRTGAAAVTDSIAQARGETPPSLEKWRARQASRAARGEKPEADPGPWRRRWRNAAERSTTKAAQKHQARMEILEEDRDANVTKHKQRMRRRAARREAAAARIAAAGHTSWDAAKETARKAREGLEGAQAWKDDVLGNTGRGPGETPPGPGPDTAPPGPAPTPATTPESEATRFARVIPFRVLGCVWQETDDGSPCGDPRQAGTDLCGLHWDRRERQRTAEGTYGTPHPGPDTTTSETATDTTPERTPMTTSIEITDISSASAFCAQTARYAETVSSTLTDVSAQLGAAGQGMRAEASSYEPAGAATSGFGFGATLTGRFATAGEAMTVASEALAKALAQVAEAQEKAALAAAEMRAAQKAFDEQQSIAETVGAGRQSSTGVARQTGFYA